MIVALVICWWGKWYKSNQIKPDPTRALNTAYWVSSLSPLSLFSEYRVSPNKWQIVPDHLDWDGTIEHRSGVIPSAARVFVVTPHIILWMPPRRRGWHGWAETRGAMRDGRVIERQAVTHRAQVGRGPGHDKWMEHRPGIMRHREESSHCQPGHTQAEGCRESILYLFRLMHDDSVPISSL